MFKGNRVVARYCAQGKYSGLIRRQNWRAVLQLPTSLKFSDEVSSMAKTFRFLTEFFQGEGGGDDRALKLRP